MLRNFHRLAGRPDYRQALLALLGMLLGLAVFIAAERTIAPRHSFVTLADDSIPFVPLSWFVYVLFFPFVIVASAYAPAHEFNMFKAATLLAFIAGMVCFQLFPELMPRPDPALIDNTFLRQRFMRMWRVDLASNGFPSLHVAVTCLACRMLRADRYKRLVAGTGLLICVSTLTVKQHTLADVSGGALLAVLCSLLVGKWQTWGASRGRA